MTAQTFPSASVRASGISRAGFRVLGSSRQSETREADDDQSAKLTPPPLSVLEGPSGEAAPGAIICKLA